MSRRTRDLDARIRRAWPDAEGFDHQQPDDALLAEIDRRIASERDTIDQTTGPVPLIDAKPGQRRSRRLATVLAAVVLLVGAGGLAGLINQRLDSRSNEQVRLSGNATDDLRDAVARTRAALESATVASELRLWTVLADTDVASLRRTMAESSPTDTGTKIMTADGDWFDINVSHREGLMLGYRRVDDQWYLGRGDGVTTATWMHVVDFAAANPGIEPPIDRGTVLEALNRVAGVAAEVTENGGVIRYRAVGGPELEKTAGELGGYVVRGPFGVPGRAARIEVVAIVDARSGLVRSVESVAFYTGGSLASVYRGALSFGYGDSAPTVSPPANAEDVTYEEYCAQPRVSCEPDNGQ